MNAAITDRSTLEPIMQNQPTWRLSLWPWLPCQPADKLWTKKAIWVSAISCFLGLYPALFFTMQAHLIDHGHAQIKVLMALLCTYGFQTLCWRHLEWYLGTVHNDMQQVIWQNGLHIWRHHKSSNPTHMPFREHVGSIADYYCNWWPWAHSLRTLTMSIGAMWVMHHHAPSLCWPLGFLMLGMLQCTHWHQKTNQYLSQRSQAHVAHWLEHVAQCTKKKQKDAHHNKDQQQRSNHHGQLAWRSLKALHRAHTQNRSIRSAITIIGLSWIFAQTWWRHRIHLLSLGDMVMCMGLSIQTLELLYGLNEQWLLWHTGWSKAKRAQQQCLITIRSPTPQTHTHA